MSGRSVRKLDEGARNRFSSSRLVQLLQQWQLLEPPAQWPGLGEDLSRWMGWTDAVALSAVLSGEPAADPGAGLDAASPTRPAASGRAARTPAQVREGLAQVRDSLLADIDTDPLFTAVVGGKALATAQAASAPDFAACRRQHQAHQRAMERQIAPWRDTLRALLARSAARQPLSPEGEGSSRATGASLAVLAALDRVMASALQERESYLLARLPAAMERHFARLCAGEPPGSVVGLASFITDLQALLRAELEFRLEPMEGMLEALNLPGWASRPEPITPAVEMSS